MFQKTKLMLLDIAAPSIPYLGINKKFNTTLIINDKESSTKKYFCFSDMFKYNPTEPQKELTICPKLNIINESLAFI